MPTTTIDTTVTRARLIRGSTADGYHTDEFVDMGPSTTIDYYDYFGGPTGDTGTSLYIVEMDGHPFPSEDYFPTAPSGYTLTDVRPWVSAFLEGGQVPIDGSSFGYSPNPTKTPFLLMFSTEFPTFDTFGSTYPPDKIACAEPDDLSLFRPGGGGAGADQLSNGDAAGGSHTHIIVTAFGYRFTYTSPAEPTRSRLHPRDDEDGIFSSPRLWPPSKTGARLFSAPP